MEEFSGVLYNKYGIECCATKNVIFFSIFGFISYERVGDVSILKVFGITVYKRAGKARAIFGFLIK